MKYNNWSLFYRVIYLFSHLLFVYVIYKPYQPNVWVHRSILYNFIIAGALQKKHNNDNDIRIDAVPYVQQNPHLDPESSLHPRYE